MVAGDLSVTAIRIAHPELFSQRISFIAALSVTLIIGDPYLQCRKVANTVATEDNRR